MYVVVVEAVREVLALKIVAVERMAYEGVLFTIKDFSLLFSTCFTPSSVISRMCATTHMTCGSDPHD